jgi:hypothetical protein
MPQKKEIKVEVEDVSNKMFMTQHLGDGSLGEKKFNASFTLPTMGLLVEVGGKKYLVSSQSLIQAIVELDDKK